ncbi:MAG: ATP-dependent Clp protease ATP-binding subunit [Acholeplasmatales bacterium]|jgi:ATP-dependent Clp protease ATP-binding subunit ClpC|nr:ATP-dependent Clp protease ATP-binding subunit [Acholeplasmatales bacterium]MCI9653378.1 ATP-dependent Clp protease ATP-binding subunit [Acholeplasmatales bacterium]
MEELNARAKQVFDLMKKYSLQNNIKTMGSEFLILAMYETEDSLCHFLLDEYDVTREEIEEKTKNVFILRKDLGEFNASLEAILHQAKLLAGDHLISEEHLFMAVLMNKNTIACSILEALELNIDELIADVKDIYDFDHQDTNEISFVRNITKEAKNEELDTFVDRSEYLKRLDVILHRKYKNNPLLIGNAGVGKTAIVEGYAQKLVKEKSEVSILALNLTSMLAGTRYRGDFEERFDKFIKEIGSKKNVIIFIDEIHTIIGAATTDGNLDVANMLKPLLARNGIKLIGATTLEEYHKTIEKDKALARRFQTVFVSEPTLSETEDILFGLRPNYEKFHNVHLNDEVLKYLITESDRSILNKFRPDKCIDILDDMLSSASIAHKTEVTKDDVDVSIQTYLGNKILKDTYTLHYPSLEKYKWLYFNHLLDEQPLLKLKYHGISEGLEDLVTDCREIFNIGHEAVLSLDLSGYKDSFMLTSLIGAPPGYIGYEDEGILSKHILAYPSSILVLKNFHEASGNVSSFLLNCIRNGYYTDQKSRLIQLKHVIVIVEGIQEKKLIGFSEKLLEEDALFDEVISSEKNTTANLNYIYEKALSRLNYEISFDFDINSSNKRKVNKYLYEFTKANDKGKYEIHKEDILDNWL